MSIRLVVALYVKLNAFTNIMPLFRRMTLRINKKSAWFSYGIALMKYSQIMSRQLWRTPF